MRADTEQDFRFQMFVWGYVDAGAREVSAIAAEDRHCAAYVNGWSSKPIWDDPSMLKGVVIYSPSGTQHAAPDRHALPWVTIHLIREQVNA